MIVTLAANLSEAKRAALSQVIVAAADTLNIKPERRSAFTLALEQIGEGHPFLTSVVRDPVSGKARRAHLDRLEHSLAEARHQLAALGSVTKLKLATALQSSQTSTTTLTGFEFDLRSVHVAVEVLRRQKASAGPRVNAALNHLVGALTLAMLRFTGQRPTAYCSAADGMRRHVFADEQAKTIRDVVRCLEPGCSDETIVNQIRKIRRAYTDEQLRATFEPSLMNWRVTAHHGPHHA